MGRSLVVQPDVQEVIAEEDAALEQQEEEADAVPDDARLLHGQRAVVVLVHLLGWQAETQAGQAATQTKGTSSRRAPPEPPQPRAATHGHSSP